MTGTHQLLVNVNDIILGGSVLTMKGNAEGSCY